MEKNQSIVKRYITAENAFDLYDRNKSYSRELKKAAVIDYLNEQGLLVIIVNKYGI